jgi:hypothetical protein
MYTATKCTTKKEDGLDMKGRNLHKEDVIFLKVSLVVAGNENEFLWQFTVIY